MLPQGKRNFAPSSRHAATLNIVSMPTALQFYANIQGRFGFCMFWKLFIIHLINNLVRVFDYILENISAKIMAIDLFLIINQILKSEAFCSDLIKYIVILICLLQFS